MVNCILGNVSCPFQWPYSPTGELGTMSSVHRGGLGMSSCRTVKDDLHSTTFSHVNKLKSWLTAGVCMEWSLVVS